MKTLGRVLTAMITPFHEDGSVDFEGAVKLGEYLLSHGSDGLVICGTTGEGSTISEDDKFQLFSVMIDALKGKGSLIANVGCNDTMRSVAFAKRVATLPVDGMMAIVPYYNKPNQEGCYRHFKAIAEAVQVPIIVYNVPGRTGSSISNDVILRLAEEYPHVCALKDATGDIQNAAELLREAPEGFMLYSGDDALTLPLLSVGACGVISVSSHVAGQQMNDMIQAYERGEVVKAREIDWKLSPLFRGMFLAPNPIPVKTAVAIMGLPAGPFHLPLVEANIEQTMQIKDFVEQCKDK